MISNLKKNPIKLLVLIAAALLISSRLYQLQFFPVSLTHDEIVYTLQAQSFAVQGTTANQKLSPWSLQPVHPWYAELPSVIMAPFFFLGNNPRLSAHLLPALMSILFPFVLASFVHRIWNDSKLSLVTWFVTAFNPLWWQFGRLAYDFVFSIFFYFLGGTLFLSKKKWQVYLGGIFLTIGFFQYQGLKLILLPWVASLLLLKFDWSKKLLKLKRSTITKHLRQPSMVSSLLVVAAMVMIFFYYVFILLPAQDTENRLKSALTGNQVKVGQLVNVDRRLSLQNSLTPIFYNKVTKSIQLSIDRGISAFSPNLLFANGEPAASGFAIWGHGYFYLIDGLLLGIGIYASINSKKKSKQSLLLLILIPILATAVFINSSSEWYLVRSSMAYTILLIFISWGLYSTLKSKIKWIVIPLYLVSIVWFAHHFYYRYPVYSADNDLFFERVLANYVTRVQQENPDQKVMVYTVDPPIMFASYLVHTNQMNRQNADLISAAINNQNWEWGSTKFSNDCVDQSDPAVINITEPLREACPEEKGSDDVTLIRETAPPTLNDNQIDPNKVLDIAAVIDSGTKYHIHHDTFCQQFNLNTFTQVTKLADFDIENQTSADFCYKWVTDFSLIEN
jgi:hypothetical protein